MNETKPGRIIIESDNPFTVAGMIRDMTEFLLTDGFDALYAWMCEKHGPEGDTEIMKANLRNLHDVAANPDIKYTEES